MMDGSPRTRSRGRPKTSDAASQRARVVTSARDVFLHVGYDATTMDAVAQRAGISKKTLYQLFDSKDAVFAAIIEAHRELMLDVPTNDDERPLSEALAAIFRVDLNEDEERDRIALLRLIMLEGRRRPELARVVVRHGPEVSRRILAGWLARQAERGRIVALDPDRLAAMLLHMMFAPVGFDDDGPVFPGPTERKAHVAMATEVFLHGVVPRSTADDSS